MFGFFSKQKNQFNVKFQNRRRHYSKYPHSVFFTNRTLLKAVRLWSDLSECILKPVRNRVYVWGVCAESSPLSQVTNFLLMSSCLCRWALLASTGNISRSPLFNPSACTSILSFSLTGWILKIYCRWNKTLHLQRLVVWQFPFSRVLLSSSFFLLRNSVTAWATKQPRFS